MRSNLPRRARAAVKSSADGGRTTKQPRNKGPNPRLRKTFNREMRNMPKKGSPFPYFAVYSTLPFTRLCFLDLSIRIIQINTVSVTLEFDDETLASLPLGPGERERHMQIELACRYYGSGWLSFGQAARMAGLEQYALGVALPERGIPRQ